MGGGGAAAPAAWRPTPAGVSGASPDGRWLAIFRPFTPWLHVYRLPDLEPVAILTNRANVARFAFSPQGDLLAVGSRGRVELWSTANWQRSREITSFVDLIFAPDGRSWWLTRDWRTGGLYDARTLEPLLPLPDGMVPLALSPDGRCLAVGVHARQVQVWDLADLHRRFRELGLDWGESH